MVVGEPWERVGVDITGPHPVSNKGNIYILTLIDHFTKWVELFPMRNQEASTVARLLVDRVFCVHGMPHQLLTDQGANFESELFREICSRLSIDKIRTTAYKPSTNGNIERFHSTLNSILAKWVSENHRDWDDKVPAVAFAYRTSVHEATGFTPYFLLHGREARTPADLVYGPPGESEQYTSTVEFVAAQQEKIRDAFAIVREHLGVAAERRKDRYDMRTRPSAFKPGTFVWCLVPRRRRGRSHKWQSFYEGPFLVTRQLGPVNAEIQRSSSSRKLVVHVDKLKPCFSPGLQSWLPQPSDPGNRASTSANDPEPNAPSTEPMIDDTDSRGGDDQQLDSDDDSHVDARDAAQQRPRRRTRLPARLRD